MQKFLYYIMLLPLMAGMFNSCKKEKETVTFRADDVTVIDYEYNTATKRLSPQNSVSAQITSAAGIRHIYTYLVRPNFTDTLVKVEYADETNTNSYNYSLPAEFFNKFKMQDVAGLKLMIMHHDNTAGEGRIVINSFTPPLPELRNFADTLRPDDNDVVHITGQAYSGNGIVKVEIFDDSRGDFTLVESIPVAGHNTTYNLDYQYHYRPNASNIRVKVTDIFDLTSEKTINMPILPYIVYQDVNMGAQGTASVTVPNNIFFAETGSTLGSCDIPANETKLDFLFYGTSTGPQFYSPSNTANVAANFRCNGVGWTINTPGGAAALKATRFRVLVPGASAEIDALYAKFSANQIADLNADGFFDGIPAPSSSTARYAPPPTVPAQNIFNTTDAYLIWIRMVKDDGTFRNGLMRVKEAVSAGTAGLSTVKFDIYIAK